MKRRKLRTIRMLDEASMKNVRLSDSAWGLFADAIVGFTDKLFDFLGRNTKSGVSPSGRPGIDEVTGRNISATFQLHTPDLETIRVFVVLDSKLNMKVDVLDEDFVNIDAVPFEPTAEIRRVASQVARIIDRYVEEQKTILDR